MTRTQTLSHLALFTLALTLAALPGRVHAQDSEFGSEELTPPGAVPAPSTSRVAMSRDELTLALDALDPYASDSGLRRGRRFRRAGMGLSLVGLALVIGGGIGVAVDDGHCSGSGDFCIDLGPIGGYFTMGVGGFVLLNGLVSWIIGDVIEHRHWRALRASVDAHGASLGVDLRF